MILMLELSIRMVMTDNNDDNDDDNDANDGDE